MLALIVLILDCLSFYFFFFFIKVKVSYSLIAVEECGYSLAVSSVQLMRGGGHPFPFAALSFPNSKKVPIYCWIDIESFPVVIWQSPASNSHFTATFCTITETL